MSQLSALISTFTYNLTYILFIFLFKSIWFTHEQNQLDKEVIEITAQSSQQRRESDSFKCWQLVSFPKAKNVKKLTKHQYSYRLRVGDYRVFFEFDGEVKIVTIEEVKKRDERTY